VSRPRKPPSPGRRSRNKGRAYEQEIARRFQHIYPNARRGLGQARQAHEVADVTGTPFWIECKHKRALNVHGAFAQALAAKSVSASATQALVVSRHHGSGRDLATMDLDAFLTILHELELLRTHVAKLLLAAIG
jgi:hypothetical protein